MWTTSVTVMVVLLKCNSEIYLITAMFKVLSQQLQGTLTTHNYKAHFERHFEDFTDMDQHTR